MIAPDASALLAALLFTPRLVTRFPIGKRAPVLRMMCSCEKELKPVDCVHKIYSSPELSGHVWVGRCEKCGHWYWGAQLDKGMLARRPLEIKRHKIITKAK
jgi:hypothetical protein